MTEDRTTLVRKLAERIAQDHRGTLRLLDTDRHMYYGAYDYEEHIIVPACKRTTDVSRIRIIRLDKHSTCADAVPKTPYGAVRITIYGYCGRVYLEAETPDVELAYWLTERSLSHFESTKRVRTLEANDTREAVAIRRQMTKRFM